MEFSRQEYWSGLPFPSPVHHILSELSSMTHPSWVVLLGVAHSFIELDKAVVHVIRLVSFLWLWFLVNKTRNRLTDIENKLQVTSREKEGEGAIQGSGREKVKVLITQSCLTLCNGMECSPPGSSVHGILQARTLERVAISFSRGSSWPRDQTWVSWIAGIFFTIWATREAPKVLVTQSCPTFCDPMDCSLPGSSVHGKGHEFLLELHEIVCVKLSLFWPRCATCGILDPAQPKINQIKNSNDKGFPCSSVVKNPPANAGDLGSIPDTRGSHVHQNLTKPVSHNYWACALEPVLHDKSSQHNEKRVHHNQRVVPHSLQLKKSPHSNEDPCTAKNK